jgi:hypothetical protein
VTVRRAWKLAALIALIAVAALYLPLDFLRPPVERALARGLGREVEIGEVYLDLFGRPGFTLDDVVIHEDPRAGIEPFAYVNSLGAKIRWLSLFRRHLEFADLNLGDATINVVKTDAGPWNFQFLLDGGPAGKSPVPAIKMRAGRVNFKFGDIKSVFYFDKADLDVQPYRDGSVELRFGGAPSRTDSTGRDFGLFFVNGTWRSSPAQRLDLNVDLERSSLAEVSRLVDPRGFGVHGVIALQAQLSGPPSGLEISGQLQVDDLHRWDLVPQGGGWKLPIRGALDLRRETLDLSSAPDAPVSLSFRAWDFLSKTQWEAGAQMNQIPLAALAEVARHMGVALPDQITAEGGVSGSLTYKDGGFTGRVDLKDAALTLPGAPTLRASSAALDIAEGEVSLEPSTVEIGAEKGAEASEKESAELQGSYTLLSPRDLDLRIVTRGLNVGYMRSFSLAAIPLLDQTKTGTWRGWARYRDGEWSGEYDLLNARIAVDGLADPLRIQSASVKLNGARVAVTKLRAKAGQIAFTGDYHWEPAALRPHKFNIAIDEADAPELARLLAPALVRERGFLARTLRLDSAPAPEWLKSRRADGTISIGALTAGDLSLSVNPTGSDPARLLWDAGIVRLIGVDGAMLSANLAGTGFGGDLEVDLGLDQKGGAPHYHFDGKIRDAPYKGGKLDFDGVFDADGEPLQWIETAHAEGHLRARSIVFSSDTEFPLASACFELQGTHWKLGSVEVMQGGETYFGTGASQSDGRLVLDLVKGSRQVRFSGPLFAAAP